MGAEEVRIDQIDLKRHEEKFEEIINLYRSGNISKPRKELMISSVMSAIENECGGINAIMRRKDTVTKFYDKIRVARFEN